MISQPPGVVSGNPSHRKNAVLAALPPNHYHRISEKLQRVPLKQGELVYRSTEPMRKVLFPETCMLSVLASFENGTHVELAQVGWRGMLGIYLAVGSKIAPYDVMAVIPGTALQMDTENFVSEFKRPGAFQDVVLTSMRRQLFMMAQRVGCNRVHSVHQRMAFLLLCIHDEVGGTEFPMTHEFMGTLLGNSRPEIAKAAHDYREFGCIAYARAKIKIVDRIGLEASSCECYRNVRAVLKEAAGAAGRY
jgi:CRP-like cAMP-binding protein